MRRWWIILALVLAGGDFVRAAAATPEATRRARPRRVWPVRIMMLPFLNMPERRSRHSKSAWTP